MFNPFSVILIISNIFCFKAFFFLSFFPFFFRYFLFLYVHLIKTSFLLLDSVLSWQAHLKQGWEIYSITFPAQHFLALPKAASLLFICFLFEAQKSHWTLTAQCICKGNNSRILDSLPLCSNIRICISHQENLHRKTRLLLVTGTNIQM